jgi:Zonular occludens toxin (Zot).
VSDYAITGKKGSGKSLITVTKLYRHLKAGLRVATNIDLFLDVLMPPTSKATVIRVPDFPTADQLWSLGKGSDSVNEESFGILALDELSVFLNSRQWRDTKRGEIIDYLRHTRKERWHTFMLSQGLKSMDSQLRDELLDHNVILRRLDKIPVPYIGGILRLLAFSGRFLKLHIAFVRYGMAHNAPIVDRWYFIGNKRIYQSYDTEQIFTAENKLLEKQYPYYTNTPLGYKTYHSTTHKVDVLSSYCLLSAWHLKGRYMSPFQLHRTKAIMTAAFFAAGYFAYTAFTITQSVTQKTNKQPTSQTQPTEQKVNAIYDINGVIHNGYFYVVILNDGQIHYSKTQQIISEQKHYLIAGKLHTFQQKGKKNDIQILD